MAKHGNVRDSGEYFVINPVSRKVIVPHAHKAIGVVGDHLSEQIRFECPEFIDGHEVSKCSERYVYWTNVDGHEGSDRLDLVEVENGTAGMIYLAWNVRDALTVGKGIVQFSIHFEDLDEKGDVLYRWGTASCKECEILDSINGKKGTYPRVYVDGERLVFADYAPVTGGKLNLTSLGITPVGTLTITENGVHNVLNHEFADVQVPTGIIDPQVGLDVKNVRDPETGVNNGIVTVTLNGETKIEKSLKEYAARLCVYSYNIIEGQSMLGVSGTHKCPENETIIQPRYGEITATLVNDAKDISFEFDTVVYCYDNENTQSDHLYHIEDTAYKNGGKFKIAKGSLFCVNYSATSNDAVNSKATVVLEDKEGSSCVVGNYNNGWYDGKYHYVCVGQSLSDVTIRLVKT